MQIDHDPDEPKRDPERSQWPWVTLMFILASAALWATRGIDWVSALAGGCVAFGLAFWYIDFMRYDFFKSWRKSGRDRSP